MPTAKYRPFHRLWLNIFRSRGRKAKCGNAKGRMSK